MTIKRLAFVAMISGLLAGCGTSATIKKVEDQQVDDLKASATTKPVQLTKVVVKLKRGEHVGAWEAGILCIPHGDLSWKGGRLNIESEEFTEAFKEELEKHSFKTVGDSNALFDDPSTWKSEILVAGMINELKANICYPMAGFGNFSNSKGKAFIKVDWQVYSILDRSVVHTVSTEGAYQSDSGPVDGGDSVAVLNAFSQATRNLLADSTFREIVSRGGESVKKTTIKAGENTILRTESSKSIGSEPKEWADAVVTVFAGRGHGSGFVIADNLILTNHHVVSESNSVAIQFNSGLRLIGKVIASNSGRDVAVVRIDGAMPKHFRLSKSIPAVGSEVYAIGSPRNEKFHSTVSKGIVSGVRNEHNKFFIQSDVNILPGNSGGPLVDKTGTVVGVAVSGMFINDAPQGINFFIPVSDALQSLGMAM
ncbi:MAG: trypsin-like peptidase domain-containing protein [Alphaproteobacteria bacterium]|nr:trypsin-like peptidase domain-containing protein [Alphaproteobacteria bacterium]MBF0393388.1 trypsin-like peptidase domain-containing protein [Alphaproteobacteria bacterium]